MQTQFYQPSLISQVETIDDITGLPNIAWNHSEFLISSDSCATTAQPLYTISGLWMEKFLSKTNQLWLTNLNIPTNTNSLTGIEFQLHLQRAARIEDLLIQLTLNGSLIGENRASTINPVQSDMYTDDFTTPLNPVQDYNIYGSATDMWGTTLTSADIVDPTFGIVISFKSNQIYPHRDLAYVDQVGIRITYA
jgi:hypothetical protein